MATAPTKDHFLRFLTELQQTDWDETIIRMLPAIHPVDRSATQIWFSFWPLKLNELADKAPDPKAFAIEYELEGRYPLRQVLDESIHFLYGSRYWFETKEALVAYIDQTPSSKGQLEEHIRTLAAELSAQLNVPVSWLTGLTSVAFMALRQVGVGRFAEKGSRPPSRFPSTPERHLKERAKERRAGLLGFLRTIDQKHLVIFDESRDDHRFEAIHGQDLSLAAANDGRDLRHVDYRRVEGPIPSQCRSGACGSCWVGILHGENNLDPIDDFEAQRLQHFGGLPAGRVSSHPLIRLACQARCRGQVRLTVPPWNGVLKGRT